jgi:hypothetical protein
MRTNNQLEQALLNVGFVRVSSATIKTAGQPVPEQDIKPDWMQLTRKEQDYYIKNIGS